MGARRRGRAAHGRACCDFALVVAREYILLGVRFREDNNNNKIIIKNDAEKGEIRK